MKNENNFIEQKILKLETVRHLYSVKKILHIDYKYTELLLRETSFISETLTESSACCKLVLLFSSFVSATSAILM